MEAHQKNIPQARVAKVMASTNNGVALLVGRRYHEAVNVFTGVLSCVQELLNEYHEQQFFTDSEDNTLTRQGPFSRFLRSEEAAADVGSSSPLFVCRSPIVVNRDYAVKAPSHALLKLSSVALYNLALTYHLGALETKPCQKIFGKALNCYRMAQDLQPQDDSDLGLLLNMAIANNIGHIHGFLGNFTKAGQCFQHLLSSIMYMTDCGECAEACQLEGFLRNVQALVLQHGPAPAA